MTNTKQAIIKISVTGKKSASINYSRRMYAIIRRYTPQALEGEKNECFAELTGLRTFFKMSYVEIAENIVKDLRKEIGVTFTLKITSPDEFEEMKNLTKRVKSVATYKEMNSLFAGKSFVAVKERKILHPHKVIKKIRLTVPFIGKVK